MSHNHIAESKSDGGSSRSNVEQKEGNGEENVFDFANVLGLAENFLTFARPGVDTGFRNARTSTNFDVSTPTGILDVACGVGRTILGEDHSWLPGLELVSNLVGMMGNPTDGIPEGSNLASETSLTASDTVFTGVWNAALISLGWSKETVESCMFVLKLLQQLGDGVNLSPGALYNAMSVIMRIEQICEFNSVKPIAHGQRINENLLCYLPWALGSYRKHLLRYVPGNVLAAQEEFEGAYEKLTGGRIIMSKLGKGTCEPTYVLGFDRERTAVVVAFRGTASPGDALTDLMCEHVRWTLLNDVSDAYVHKGFYESAKKICSNLRGPVLQALDVSVLAGQWVLSRVSAALGKDITITYENNSGYPQLRITALQSSSTLEFLSTLSYTCSVGTNTVVIKLRRDSFTSPTIDISVHNKDLRTVEEYTASRRSAKFKAPFRVVLCGHSLGAAIASVVASIWLATNCFGTYNLVCFGYCPPCVFSMPLARNPIFLKSIYSIVVGHDIVSRLCMGSVWELRELIMNLQKLTREQPEAHKKIQDTLNPVSYDGIENQKAAIKILLEEDLQLGGSPHRKMFPAGRTFHIPSGVSLRPEHLEGLNFIEFHSNCLSSIILRSTILLDHMTVFQTMSPNNSNV